MDTKETALGDHWEITVRYIDNNGQRVTQTTKIISRLEARKASSVNLMELLFMKFEVAVKEVMNHLQFGGAIKGE